MPNLQTQLTTISELLAAIHSFLLGDGQLPTAKPKTRVKWVATVHSGRSRLPRTAPWNAKAESKGGRSHGKSHGDAIRAGYAAKRKREAKEARAKQRASKAK